eukprot:m.235384 g.235384  ORF g.235384 m.235384 type:complete len:498 (+) comp20056_c0_seq1:66-1559(+)
MAHDSFVGEPLTGSNGDPSRSLGDGSPMPSCFAPVLFRAAEPMSASVVLAVQGANRTPDPAGPLFSSHQQLDLGQSMNQTLPLAAHPQPISQEQRNISSCSEGPFAAAFGTPLASGGSLPTTPQSNILAAPESHNLFAPTTRGSDPMSLAFSTAFESPLARFGSSAVVPTFGLNLSLREAHSDSEASSWTRQASEPLSRYRSANDDDVETEDENEKRESRTFPNKKFRRRQSTSPGRLHVLKNSVVEIHMQMETAHERGTNVCYFTEAISLGPPAIRPRSQSAGEQCLQNRRPAASSPLARLKDPSAQGIHHRSSEQRKFTPYALASRHSDSASRRSVSPLTVSTPPSSPRAAPMPVLMSQSQPASPLRAASMPYPRDVPVRPHPAQSLSAPADALSWPAPRSFLAGDGVAAPAATSPAFGGGNPAGLSAGFSFSLPAPLTASNASPSPTTSFGAAPPLLPSPSSSSSNPSIATVGPLPSSLLAASFSFSRGSGSAV